MKALRQTERAQGLHNLQVQSLGLIESLAQVHPPPFLLVSLVPIPPLGTVRRNLSVHWMRRKLWEAFNRGSAVVNLTCRSWLPKQVSLFCVGVM